MVRVAEVGLAVHGAELVEPSVAGLLVGDPTLGLGQAGLEGVGRKAVGELVLVPVLGVAAVGLPVGPRATTVGVEALGARVVRVAEGG